MSGIQASDGGLLSYADLEARWNPPSAIENRKARRLWIRRRIRELGLRPALGGRGDSVRYRLAAVLAAEEKHERARAYA